MGVFGGGRADLERGEFTSERVDCFASRVGHLTSFIIGHCWRASFTPEFLAPSPPIFSR